MKPMAHPDRSVAYQARQLLRPNPRAVAAEAVALAVGMLLILLFVVVLLYPAPA